MEPKKHHYIPTFYLKRWSSVNSDRKLVQFSRPNGNEVKPLRVAPGGTGYVERLYEMNGYPPHLAQQIEKNFFQPVDSVAAEALGFLELGKPKREWSDDHVSGWIRFIMSLLMRCPEDIEIHRETWARDFSVPQEHLQSSYDTSRNEHDPKSYIEAVHNLSDEELERYFFESLIDIHNNKAMGHRLINMQWTVLDFSGCNREFLTSDRPVIMTDGLDGELAHLALPISPNSLFLASNTNTPVELTLKKSPRAVIADCNATTVTHAKKYCYATSDAPLRFVQKRMSKRHQWRIAELIRNGEI
jgi:hypothetical protein